MFERERHRAISTVLEAFDAPALSRLKCLFAGGTRIALDHGEYRESRDVDFLCSNAERYAELRMALRREGYAALFTHAGREHVGLPREMRSDQYGVRFPALVGNVAIRIELVRESRFELEAPVVPSWSPIPCISVGDCFTAKLLANSDRWADRDVLSRDLLDLAVLREAHGAIPEKSWVAAERAYKQIVRSDLERAADSFLSDAPYRSRCFSGLSVRAEREPGVLRGVQALRNEASPS